MVEKNKFEQMAYLNSVLFGDKQRTKQNYDEVLSMLNSIFNEYKKLKESDDELLTRDETAKLLKCTKGTVNNWTSEGFLNVYGIGNKVYYKKNEVLKSLKKINI